MSATERLDTFEATARMLDEHPELTDELYSVVKKHPGTMNRFLDNAARDLKEEPIARATAERLVQHPDSLERTLVTTTDHVVRSPDARAAMNRAIASRAQQTADVLSDDPNTLSKVLGATLVLVEQKPRARQSLLVAVRNNRSRLLAVIEQDKKLSKEIGEELLRELVEDKPALEKLLRGVKIIDDK